MTRRIIVLGGILSALCVGAGCNKGTAAAGATTSGTEAAGAAKTAAASAPAPAPSAAASGAATPAVADTGAVSGPSGPSGPGSPTGPAGPAGSSGPASPASPTVPAGAASAAGAATAAPAAAVDPEVAGKNAKIEWALKQQDIKNDPNGQWAVQAKASSTYNNAQGTAAYSASQATGLPNIESFGNSISAWTPATPDAGIEWLELQYAKPVFATVVRVRESYGAGAVIKLELFDEKGASHTVWTGADSTKDLEYLVAEFPKTAFKTARIRVTLATNVVSGLNEIDAVQLVGTER